VTDGKRRYGSSGRPGLTRLLLPHRRFQRGALGFAIACYEPTFTTELLWKDFVWGGYGKQAFAIPHEVAAQAAGIPREK
jgi:hypothetical protein